MDSLTAYTKTGRGLRAQIKKLPPNAGQILFAMNSTSTAAELHSKLRKMNIKDFDLAISWLLEGDYIRTVSSESFSNSVWAPVTQSAIKVDEISFDEFNETIKATIAEAIEALAKTGGESEKQADTLPDTKPGPMPEAIHEPISQVKKADAANSNVKSIDEAKAKALAKADAETRERAEAQALAVTKAKAEAAAKAEAELKEQQEADIRAKIEREAEEQAEAEEKAKREAERALSEQQAKAQAEASNRARLEAEKQAREIAEAEARAKAEALAKADAEARERAEAEARKFAEAKEKAEAEKRAKAEAKALKEAEERAKAEAERLAKEAEIRAIAEAKAQEEEARLLAEKLAKEQADAEARAIAEAAEIARLEAEAEAKRIAEALAAEEARLLAEQRAKEEAASRARAEVEAKAKAAAEARAKAEAEEEARLLAKQKAAEKAKKRAARKAAIVKFKQKIRTGLESFKSQKVARTTRFHETSFEIDEAIIQSPRRSFSMRRFKKASKQWSASVFGLIKTTLFIAVALLVVTLLAAQFINISVLVKPIETLVSENLQEPVNIENVHATLFPEPHLILENVVVGADKNAVKAASIKVYPVVNVLIDRINKAALYAEKPYEIESLKIDSLTLAQADLQRAANWLDGLKKHQQLNIDNLVFDKITLQLNNVTLPMLAGAIVFDQNEQLKTAALTTEDKNLSLNIEHSLQQYKFNLKASKWRSPIGASILFNELTAGGFLENGNLTIAQIDSDLYEGKLQGNLLVDLNNRWQAKGDIALNNINMKKAAEDLKSESILTGNLSMNSNFTFIYNHNSNTIEASTLNARFKVNSGNLERVALIEAMRTGNLGGTTQFDELSGSLVVANQNYEFRNLTLQDNQLQAYGKLIITSNKTVNADIYSKIPLKSNPIKAHLIIEGTTDSLQLKK